MNTGYTQHQFSVAICPPEEIVLEVRAIKQELAQKIIKFSSLNAEAHFTFNEFNAYEYQIKEWKKYLTDFCNTTTGSFDIRLTDIKSYSNGALFLAPDKESKSKITTLMKSFHKVKVYPVNITSINPHLTIARSLTQDQLKIAFDIFSNRKFDISFTCTNLALRKFNGKVKQYRIDERFIFGEEAQLSLF